LGEVETKHLINRRRGKADVRVTKDGIEFLDAGGRRFVELVLIEGRWNNVWFIYIILIHIIRRRVVIRKGAGLITSSGLGCKVHRIEQRVPANTFIRMVRADNTTIDHLFRLVIIDAVGQFITDVRATSDKISSSFFGFWKSINMVKIEDTFPKNKLKETGNVPSDAISSCGGNEVAFSIPCMIVDISKVGSS